MFRGRFEYSIDDKGRLSIPAKFREVVRAQGEDRLMVTNWLENCLSAYPLSTWREIEERVASLSDFDRNARTLKRYFLGGAVDLTFDRQGRILIPPSLRKYAELDRNVVVLGLHHRFEIWSLARWEEQESIAQESFGEVAQALADSGLRL